MPRNDWTNTQIRELAKKRERARLKKKTRRRLVEERKWRRLEETATLQHIRDNRVTPAALARLVSGHTAAFQEAARKLWRKRESDRLYAETQERILFLKKRVEVERTM